MDRLFFILIFLLFFPNVYAGTVDIQFSDFDLTSQEIDIYYSNGSFIETVKSNESVTLDDNYDYQLVFRPEKMDLLNNPMAFFRMFFSSGFIRVFISIIILGALYKILKGRK